MEAGMLCFIIFKAKNNLTYSLDQNDTIKMKLEEFLSLMLKISF